MKISNTLPAGYYKASTESGFYFWDGFGANKPNEVKGRLLLIGCYDMSSEQKFGCVKYASTENLDLNFTDASSCSSRSPAELKIDGIVPEVNDRILLKDQTSKSENGIYIVTKVGSVVENFELKRASDANAINALASGKFVFVTGGNSQVNTAFQLMPYNTKLALGQADFEFINLTDEGLYANTSYGFRLLNSIVCTDIENIKNTYNFACPGFLNSSCQRMLKILVSYDVSLAQVMQNLLTKDFEFEPSSNNLGNGVVSGNLVCDNTYSYCGK